MKINGALKPRQGASKRGSSPGVVLQKYRVKRYFKANENQQQTATKTKIFKRQLEQKKNYEEKFDGCSNSNFSRKGILSEIKIKKGHIEKSRISAAIKAKELCRNINGCRKKNKILKTITTAERSTEIAKGKKNIEIGFAKREAINITTRQLKENTKLSENKQECGENKINNINCAERETSQTKVFKATLNTSRYRVTFNRNRKNQTGSTPNKFLFVPTINENINLTVIISQLFIQLKYFLLFMFTHATKYLNGYPFVDFHGSGVYFASAYKKMITFVGGNCVMAVNSLLKMKCLSQLVAGSFERLRQVNTSIALSLLLYAATAILLPQLVVGDDGDTFFPINGIETTTPEFDYASRGQKKFGDKCENTLECGFPGSICDPKKKSCQCTEDLPVTNHIDKCGKEAAVNESCFFNEQCEVKYFQTECRDQRCVCRFDMTPIWLKDGTVECKGRGDKKGPETYIDPAMIGVLIGMALMFIIICVVLRLFSQARWRENRTIFNTPNPRLMNVSLLRESKLLHGQERRGSRMSVRAPSRQPSMASLRPHSPNPSLGKTGSRSNSHGSNASATSLRSTRSNSVSPAGIVVGNNSHHERKGSTYQPHQHHHPTQQKLQPLQPVDQQQLTQTNIISNPVAETVTVEIIEPEK